MQFRVIPLTTYTGYMNMAIDEALLYLVSKGSLPVIRFYDWNPSSVTFGFSQNISDINVENCYKSNIDYVRRITGGSSILHDSGKEITYSLVSPLSLYSKRLIESYKEICKPILETLSYLNLNPSLNNSNDIVVDKRKISGNAQFRSNNALLQQGTLIYDINLERMLKFLNTNLPSEKIKNKITSIKEHSNVSKNGLYKILKENFCKRDHYIGSLTEEELNLAKELVEKKYKTLGWNNGSKKEKLREACYLS